MIPKSVVELTINVLESDLSELETVNNRIINREIEGYSAPVYSKEIKNNIDVYKLLIKEHRKYLEENYGGK